jgi:hypothetical protein
LPLIEATKPSRTDSALEMTALRPILPYLRESLVDNGPQFKHAPLCVMLGS